MHDIVCVRVHVVAYDEVISIGSTSSQFGQKYRAIVDLEAYGQITIVYTENIIILIP